VSAPTCKASAPYDGGTPVTWKVPGYDSHAVAEGSRRRTRSLCGFSWAEEQGRVVDGLPECPECPREIQLVPNAPDAGVRAPARVAIRAR
jgi:hypothetical protein